MSGSAAVAPPVAFPPAPPPVAFPPAPPPVAFPPAPPPVAFPPAPPPVVLATASKGVLCCCCADTDPSVATAINMILKAIVKVMTIHDCFINKADVLQLT